LWSEKGVYGFVVAGFPTCHFKYKQRQEGKPEFYDIHK
jgi:hypothetical protein